MADFSEGLEDFVTDDDKFDNEVKDTSVDLGEGEKEEEDKPDTVEEDKGGKADTSKPDEQEELTDDELTFFTDIQTELGVEGEFEKTPDGLKDIVKAYKTRVDEQASQFNDPLVKEFAKFRSEGGSWEEFMAQQPETDWEKLVIPEDGDNAADIQEAIVREGLLRKGNSERMIKNTIAALKAGEENDMLEEAKELKGWMAEQDGIRVKAEKDAWDKVQADKKKETDTVADNVRAIIKTGVIMGLKFDKDELTALEASVIPATKEKQKEVQDKYKNLPLEKKLILDYLIQNDVDLDKLNGRKVKTKADDIKDKKPGSTGFKGMFGKDKNTGPTVGFDALDQFK